MSDAQPDAKPTSIPAGPRVPTRSIFRLYKWESLTEPEREAVRDGLGILGLRAAVGVGVVSTIAAGIAGARRGKRPLPGSVKYGGFGFFVFLGAYAGVLSAGSAVADRVLAVPNSRLADDLRGAIGDWQARVPSAADVPDAVPAAEPGTFDSVTEPSAPRG